MNVFTHVATYEENFWAPLENQKQAENNFTRCLIEISDFIANDFKITPNGC